MTFVLHSLKLVLKYFQVVFFNLKLISTANFLNECSQVDTTFNIITTTTTITATAMITVTWTDVAENDDANGTATVFHQQAKI